MNVMELIVTLEAKIDALLAALAAERDANRRLRDELAGAGLKMEEENRTLREELDRERALKEAVLARIDGLLQKLKDETGDE
ncbi:MAG: cell division protein ZapB [Desulfovibrionaceae bacterium]